MRVSVRRASTVLMQTCHYASEQRKLGTKHVSPRLDKSGKSHRLARKKHNEVCRVFDFSISKLWGHFSSLQNGKSNSTAILDFYFMPGVRGEFCH